LKKKEKKKEEEGKKRIRHVKWPLPYMVSCHPWGWFLRGDEPGFYKREVGYGDFSRIYL